MKKYISIFAALLAFAACTKEPSMKEELVTAEFEVVTNIATKAVVDNDGVGVNVSRFVMEVWHNSNGVSELYTRKVNTGSDMTVGTSYANPAKTKFKVTFVKGQEYDVLFWADCSDGEGDLYYTTNTAEGLKAVTMKGEYIANNDKRDAFSAVVKVPADADATIFNQTIKLRRPFAQLNVITDDIDEIEANSGTEKVVPDAVELAFKAPSVFNVLTQVASTPVDYSYSAAPYYLTHKTDAAAADKYTLNMDYILAPAGEQAIAEIALTAKKDGIVLNEQTFQNIPLQRNYRTNIIGSLLTLTGEFIVEVDAVFNEPDFDVEIQ